MHPSGKKTNIKELKILIIDDDEQILGIVRFVLRDLGLHKIVTADTGKKGIDLFTDTPESFDLIICDWSMPGMSGLDVLKHIRSQDKDVPFLMLTANVTKEAILEARDAGVSAYIAKPFTPVDLQAKLKTLAGKLIA